MLAVPLLVWAKRTTFPQKNIDGVTRDVGHCLSWTILWHRLEVLLGDQPLTLKGQSFSFFLGLFNLSFSRLMPTLNLNPNFFARMQSMSLREEA